MAESDHNNAMVGQKQEHPGTVPLPSRLPRNASDVLTARVLETKWRGYVAAFVGTGVAAWCRWRLGLLLGPDLPPYITFYPVIIVSALLGGTRAGLLATVLCSTVVDYLFLPPFGLTINRPVDWAGLLIFTAINFIISSVGGSWRKARRRAEEDAKELARVVDLLKEDLAARKLAEDALQRSQYLYSSLFNAIDEGFCVLQVMFDENGTANNWRYLEVNPAFARHNGLKYAQGKTIRELAPTMEPVWFEVYARVAATGAPVRFSEFSGALNRWFDLYAFRVGEPEECKVAVLFVDITERKQAERALWKARNDLAAANDALESKVRSRTAQLEDTVNELEHFSYTLTHDMRAPLRAMRGLSDILVQQHSDVLQPLHREYLGRIADSADRLDRLITDALQYNGLVRRPMPIEPVDPGELLREMVQSYPQFQPPHASIFIENNLPVVLGNKAALTQCFSNLLSNAIKFVKPGTKPEVHIRAEETKPRNDKSNGERAAIRVVFEDNGIGIEAEYQEKIWAMFQRLDKKYDGTGVGLALVQKAAERMGGKAGVDSEPGRGSRFWVELGLAPTARSGVGSSS